MRQFSLSFSSIETKNHKIDTEKHDNIDNKRQRFFLTQKMLSKVVLRCSQKSTTTLTTKDNGSLIPS